MNLSNETRKEQVLRKLRQAQGWVDGTDLANAEVGGSEGLKRLRELRLEGYNIEMRRHPDPAREIWQYRLVPELEIVTEAGKITTLRGVDLGSVSPCPRCLTKRRVIDNRNPGHKWIDCPLCEGVGYVSR